MMYWCRLWHKTPTDPRFRTIARLAEQPLAVVIAVYVVLLTDASANERERGRVQADDETIASALDINEEAVRAIRGAMQGRLLDEDRISNWHEHQVKREDGSAERSKAYRERKRVRTLSNASERDEPIDEMRGDETRRNETIEEDNLSQEEAFMSELNVGAPPSRRSNRTAGSGTRIGENWVLAAGQREYAIEQGISPEDVDATANAFRDHWLAKPGDLGLKADWNAAWRTWVRTGLQMGKQRTRAASARSRPAI